MSKNQRKLKKETENNSESNPFESNQNLSPPVQNNPTKKAKKLKKIKKTKKKKNKKSKGTKHDYNQSEEDSLERNSMFDEEAESGEEDFDDEQLDAQQGYREQDNYFQELYKRPNATQRLLERLEGKNERQINAQYSRKALAYREETKLYPNDKDPKIYVISVKPKCEEQMVLKIMNKAKYCSQVQKEKDTQITSVMCQKKAYPGKIFVEGYSALQIKQFLNGFNDIYLGKRIQQLDNQGYNILFQKRIKEKIDLKQNTFVRIKKGLYEGDLGKIMKVKTNSIEVLLVPRINVNKIKINIQREVAKLTDEQKIKQKKISLFKLYTDHKTNHFAERPEKKQLFEADFQQLKDLPTLKNIRISSINGLIILNYMPHEVGKVYGTYLPIQVLPFTTEGKFIQEIKDDAQNLLTSIQFKKGEQVEIISGALEKHYGILKEIREGIAIIECKNKQLCGQILEESTENISKRFKLGQRIKVVSGSEKGSSGVVIKILPKEVEVFTDNQRSLMVSKRNVQFSRMQTICPENVHNIRRFDLIRTVSNSVGIVVETTKDTVKIINTSNVVQIISNMDFEKKIETDRLVGKNKKGDQITNNCLIFIANGVNKDKKCKVLHVFREFLFLFNQNLTRTLGVIVEMIDNCHLISKIKTGRKIIEKQLTEEKKEQQFNTEETGKKIMVGDAITIKSGSLKGYKGVIKTITNDRVEIRIPSKCLTEWIPLKQLIKKNQKDEGQSAGKTPIRLQSGRQFEGFYNDN